MTRVTGVVPSSSFPGIAGINPPYSAMIAELTNKEKERERANQLRSLSLLRRQQMVFTIGAATYAILAALPTIPVGVTLPLVGGAAWCAYRGLLVRRLVRRLTVEGIAETLSSAGPANMERH